MSQILDATFDGEVFRPAATVELQPNTEVQLIVTAKPSPTDYRDWLDRIAGRWQGEFERIPVTDFEERDSF